MSKYLQPPRSTPSPPDDMTEPFASFYQACLSGDLEDVKRLLPTVYPAQDDNVALHHTQSPDVINFLLRQPCVLLTSLRYTNYEVKYLRDILEEYEQKNVYFESELPGLANRIVNTVLLLLAIEHSDREQVNSLLSQDVNPAVLNLLALTLAYRSGHMDIYKILLRQPAVLLHIYDQPSDFEGEIYSRMKTIDETCRAYGLPGVKLSLSSHLESVRQKMAELINN